MADKPMPESEEGWRKQLTPEQYRVLREKGTEPPFTGEFLHAEADGTFTCAACGNKLFSSDAKFDSGTGWPSFDEALPGAHRDHLCALRLAPRPRIRRRPHRERQALLHQFGVPQARRERLSLEAQIPAYHS